jgi:hypothetical protein
MSNMLPLLIVALLVWAGVFAFIFAVDKKITAIEKRIADRPRAQRPEDDR